MQGISFKIALTNYTINHQIINKKIIMKTTNQNNRTINLRTIFYSGVLTSLVIASSFAKDACQEQQFTEDESVVEYTTTVSPKNESNSVTKPFFYVETEKEIAESTAALASEYTKSVVDIMVENEQIIESTADFDLPIYSGRTLDEVILENEMIIESNKTDDVFPLTIYLNNTTSPDNKNGIVTKNNSTFRS